MKKYISIIGIILLLLAGSGLFAQSGTAKLSLQYNYGIPLGDFKNNFIANSSPRGFMGDLSFGLNYKWALGVGIGFQDYSQKYDRSVYNLAENQQVSGVLSNSIQTVPLLFKVHYTPLGGNGWIQPYISAGAGVNFVTYNQYLGEFSSYNESKGRWAAMADAGLIIPFKKWNNSTSFLLGASYNYTDFKQTDASTLTNLGLHAGFTFAIH